MRLSSLILLLGVLSACGQSEDVSSVRSLDAGSSAAERVAFVMSGSIGDVRTVGETTDQLRTAIDIVFDLACNESLTTFSYTTIGQGSAKHRIFVSALGMRTEPTEPCSGPTQVVRTVALPGHVSKEQIELINLSGSEAPVAPSTAAWSPIQEFQVDSTRPLCPKGATCVVDGTVVSIRTTLAGCLDRLGPVTFAKLSEGKADRGATLRIAVSGVQLADRESRHVYCLVPNSQMSEIVLLNEFLTKESLDLIVVHGS